MATVQEIAEFRLMIGEPDETTYTDQQLSDMLDSAGLLGYTSVLPARDVWRQKAATYSALVDTSEGGSSRANGALFARAIQMANMYAALVDKETEAQGPTSFVTVSKLRR